MHQGNLIKEGIESSGITLTFICKQIGISRTTLYRYFEMETIPEDRFNKIFQLIESNGIGNTNEELKLALKKINELQLENSILKRKLNAVLRQV
jgi:hypothetical protein